MNTRQLGYTDLALTPLGLGTWAMGGGDNPYGWGPQDDRDSVATIQRALDLGINWIDTAKGYGHGHSEEVVGRAIAGRRDQVTIATKCGILWKEDGSDIYGCLEPASLRAEVESSLRRLRVEAIDLLQIHWPLPDTDIEAGWGAIADLVRAGKVRYAGVSNFSVAQLERIRPIFPVASLQPPYSLLHRDVEADLLGYCAAHGIGVIVYGPMAAGLLTGRFTRERAAALPADDWRHGAGDFQEPQLSANLAFVNGLRPIAQRLGTTVANLAIAWTLRRPEVTGAIVGARRPAQIEETIGAAMVALSPGDEAEIGKLLDERNAALLVPA
jgi:aryl-alcohol dehydrogenase-like predicted oxidoreductase